MLKKSFSKKKHEDYLIDFIPKKKNSCELYIDDQQVSRYEKKTKLTNELFEDKEIM